GEGPEERDLFVGEEPDLGASERDRTNGHAFAEEWHAQHSSEPEIAAECAAFRKLLRFGEICDLNRLPIKHRASVDRAANRRKNKAQRMRDGAMMGHHAEHVAVQPEDAGVGGGTEA